ncbi:hypothetical protein [Nonomuraea deserti]|uniref:hypothetical protein n=1 Tax=Nonomuraea deserti TaxID=1848322 RepID=UPI0014054FDF|nr:hypothetical protein [Nonomuraea deserti]
MGDVNFEEAIFNGSRASGERWDQLPALAVVITAPRLWQRRERTVPNSLYW